MTYFLLTIGALMMRAQSLERRDSMPNRVIREGILDSDRVNELSPQGEVFYRRLMSVVDDYGRFDARPVRLKGACFPLRIDEVREADISRWIAECEKAGLIALYAVNGKQYVEMLDFRQAVRAKFSKFPSREGASQLPCICDESDTQMSSERSASAPVVEVGDVVVVEDEKLIGRAKRANVVAKATRLPKGWELPTAWKDWALSYRTDWNEQACLRQSLVFRDYWLGKSGQDGTKNDWEATWRNWVRRTT